MKYDVIIIGGGTAGSVLAGRLSENPEISILLLEAGPDYDSISELPDVIKIGLVSTFASLPGTKHNWSFVSKANKYQENNVDIPRGKVIGGSGSINGQFLLRGYPEDFDHWASLGNDEWSYIDVLPYYRKMESDSDFGGDFHGKDGPMPVRRHPKSSWLPFQKAIYDSCIDNGFPDCPDHNAPDATGIGASPQNQVDGVRMSSALTYLNPARIRTNLTVRGNVHVIKILFDRETAIGIKAESGSESFDIYAENIVVCCGALQTPQLLMLSGIGPADHLKSMGIKIVKDLPGVGQNLRDHCTVRMRCSVHNDFPLDPHSVRNQILLCYTAKGSTSKNDMEVWVSNYAGSISEDPTKQSGKDKGCVQLGLVLCWPEAVHEIRLRSSDYRDQPEIIYRHLENSWDLERMRDGMRVCQDLIQHKAVQPIVTEIVEPTLLQLENSTLLDKWLVENVDHFAHQAGSCKMGPDSDPMAVVDQQGNVKGINGLVIADTSIMPNVTRNSTNATAIMIGERIAEWIKGSFETRSNIPE